MSNDSKETVITPLVEDHEAWVAQRSEGIGGSDIAAICGISPFSTAIDVWMQKTGRAPEKKESDAMHWGHLLEEPIAQEYARQTGNAVSQGVHLQKGCMVGNTDRMAVTPDGKKRLVEIKSTNPRMASEWGVQGSDEIPEHYLTQVQWYLGLLPAEYEMADVAVLIGGSEFRLYHVRRNQELIDQMQEIGEAWWKAYVETDNAPEPDGSLDDMRARLALHPKDNGQMLESSADIDDVARELAAAMAELKAAEDRVEGLEVTLKGIIGDASGIVGTGGLWKATYKAAKDSAVTDWKAACAKGGVSQDVIDACTKRKAGSRRFLFKPSFPEPEPSDGES